MQTCKSQCEKYKANMSRGLLRYAAGQKQCSICEIFIWWEGTKCPCCSAQLRINPRKSSSKTNLRILRQSQIV